jgi:hypothetical protein
MMIEPEPAVKLRDGPEEDTMRLTDRIRRWWKPAQWRDDHPLTAEERARDEAAGGPDGFVDAQHGMGAESYDRVDVDRDFRKP